MYLFPGPELLWALYYLAVTLLARRNVPPTPAMDRALERLWWLVPLVAVPSTFALYACPLVVKSWLLARIWVAGIFGSHYVLEKGLGAYSEQGPGIGTAYMVGIIFSLFLLGVGTVAVFIWYH